MDEKEITTTIKEWVKATNQLMITQAVQSRDIKHINEKLDGLSGSVRKVKAN